MMEAMRRIALYGLGLLLASALALTYVTSSGAKSGGPVSHTCSVTDRAFINGAKTNVDAVDLWGQQYLDGEATPADVAAESARAAKIVGLNVGKLILSVCFLAGAAAGLAGMVEVAAVQGRTNANLAAGYGFTGILVAFLARHNPLAVIPVAILLGGIGASGGLLQRRLGLPDASVLVLQGMIFVSVLASDALYGRLPFLNRKAV